MLRLVQDDWEPILRHLDDDHVIMMSKASKKIADEILFPIENRSSEEMIQKLTVEGLGWAVDCMLKYPFPGIRFLRWKCKSTF
jgi:hypothetical protein